MLLWNACLKKPKFNLVGNLIVCFCKLGNILCLSLWTKLCIDLESEGYEQGKSHRGHFFKNNSSLFPVA